MTFPRIERAKAFKLQQPRGNFMTNEVWDNAYDFPEVLAERRSRGEWVKALHKRLQEVYGGTEKSRAIVIEILNELTKVAEADLK